MITQRQLGVELEYSYEVGESFLYEVVKDVILDHSEHPIWRSHEDAHSWSVKDEHCGCELTSPALDFTKANLDMLCKIIDFLKEKFSSVCNPIHENCGLHLHVDTNIHSSDVSTWARFFKIWHLMEYPLFSVLPHHRRSNCNIFKMRNHYKDYSEFLSGKALPTRKYLTAHRVRNNHIEIRHAPSTLDSEFFFQWCALVRAMVEIAEGFALKRKFKIDDLFHDMPKDPETNLDPNVLIEFLNDHSDYIETQWVKRNMIQMIRWICKQHRELYGQIVELQVA